MRLTSSSRLGQFVYGFTAFLSLSTFATCVVAQENGDDTPMFLADQLKAEDQKSLFADVLENGNARRGALIFYRPELTCTKCHQETESDDRIGPALAFESRESKPLDLLRSILHPSETIKKGYETVVVATEDGEVFTGQVISEDDETLKLRDQANADTIIEIEIGAIEDRAASKKSLMPDGLANVLKSRQEFLDLARYVMEIAELGEDRLNALRPAAFLISTRPIPEYESHVDHAGIIRDWNDESFKRGEEIYQQLCINCHGTKDKAGSLPTSLRFASGTFKSGADPHGMYKTLTHGYGLMIGQSWMVPQQKYDVIHYIREEYLRPNNPSQYVEVNDDYLAGLPEGDTRGPKPMKYEPWASMDYGPTMGGTFEFGNDGTNFAYKGIAVRLDPGPGGVSKGNQWLIFDHDTMRVAGVWNGQGFIDWNGIHFNGRHNIHPRIAGNVQLENPVGPGWGNPADGSFDDPRLRGRDDRLYGPLPREWAHYKGMYHYGNHAVFTYTVGSTEILEMPGLETSDELSVVSRTFNIGPRDRDLTLQVLDSGNAKWQLSSLVEGSDSNHAQQVAYGPGSGATTSTGSDALRFDGGTWIDVADGDAFNMNDEDFTIVAEIKTRSGGTIFSKSEPQPEWVRDGKTLFVRGGKLCYDIGWVGVVTSQDRVNDGNWHQVAMSYEASSGLVTLFIDGERQAQRELSPENKVDGHHVRIGYTSDGFPGDPRCFEGNLANVRFFQRRLSEEEIMEHGKSFEPGQSLGDGTGSDFDKSMIAAWSLSENSVEEVSNIVRDSLHGSVKRGGAVGSTRNELGMVVGVSPGLNGHEWSVTSEGQLRLTIPAGDEPLKFSLCLASDEEGGRASFANATTLNQDGFDLRGLMQGGPERWTAELERTVHVAPTDGPFAVDIFEHPVSNPWQALVRLTGFDFFEDGDRMAVSSWDGDIWLVSGLKQLTAIESAEQANGQPPMLKWKRIASGMFQPLGVKIVDGDIYVTCRDQLCILRDLNGDGETDFYENFNNDHQVTDHFHEFAMGLQRDEEGNFYYAKSARHALTALVPHHGTLLRVSKDGSRTDILANGFRAANGVCLNPDGSFIVTDQEGHWNPKNRINWVREGGFYGNMFGYHDVTDSSDEAMDQPLCWITNRFDRSPAELLWVDSKKWGPLDGQLLNLSYGYGKIFVVPHEEIEGQMQGGMCQLPIDNLPTGVMRGRFNPNDEQLYCCGMFAWAGSATQPGGFYRLRYTGEPVHLPVELRARENGIELKFSGKLNQQEAANLSNYQVKVWSLKRTARYGSDHFDERDLEIKEVTLGMDRQTVFLEIPGLEPTWCMEVKYRLKSDEDKRFEGVIHNTIHNTEGEPFDE